MNICAFRPSRKIDASYGRLSVALERAEAEQLTLPFRVAN